MEFRQGDLYVYGNVNERNSAFIRGYGDWWNRVLESVDTLAKQSEVTDEYIRSEMFVKRYHASAIIVRDGRVIWTAELSNKENE